MNEPKRSFLAYRYHPKTRRQQLEKVSSESLRDISLGIFGVKNMRRVVRLTQQEFDELLDYSCSIPTGTIIGKKWKRRNDYHDESKGWMMGEYIQDPKGREDMVGIEWSDIILEGTTVSGTLESVRKRLGGNGR